MTDIAAAGQKSTSASSDSSSLYSTNNWFVFAGLCIIYLFFNWYLATQVLTDQLYYYSLGSRVEADKLAAFISGQHKYAFLGYIMMPLGLLARMVLVTFVLLTGLLLTSRKLPFRTVFKVVLFAESAFAAGTLLRLLLLAFSNNIESLGQLETFAPLSLYSLAPPSSIPAWLSYPLQTLDLFQVAYFFLLAAGIRYYLQCTFKKACMLTLGSYGTALLCCMILFAFYVFSNS